MKILHLISSGGMYGAEAVILNLCSAINRAGAHTSAIAVFANTSQPNFQLRDAALAAGIETHTIDCRGQLDSSVPARLQQLIRETQTDVVHTHGYKADIYAWWGLRRAGVLVATCHNWIDNDAALRVYGWLDRIVLRRFSRVVAVSEAVKSRLLNAGLAEDRVSLIRNGILLEPFQAAAAERSSMARPFCTVGFVGRLSPEKGPDIFVRAAALVLERFPSTKFILAGEGPEREALQTLIAELGVAEQVRLLGRQDDMPSLYAKLDIMVLSSRTEGLPMALLEAMASGLSVVATNVGAIPTVIENGHSGLLAPANDPSAIAGCISGLLADRARRHSMGESAKDLVTSQFSAEHMAEQYIRVYDEALAAGRTSA